VLNGRLYRASFVPLLLVLVIAGFSLSAPAGSLSSTLAPDAFNGPAAFAELQSLAARYPHRAPGSPGDEALAGEIAHTLQGLGSTASGGFSVTTRRLRANTTHGWRTLTTVIARRPGLTGATPIVLLAHRDATGPNALAELSGTAVLLQLARVLATSETQRTIIVLSTSGGSSGDAGAGDFAAHSGTPIDAAIALGDLAGTVARKPFVLSYSNSLGFAPLLLAHTLAGAISQEVGVDPGGTDTFSQLAHFALPLSVGEQGPLLAQGLPAVALQVSGERAPGAAQAVDATRLNNFGRAVLSAVYALDSGPNLPTAVETGLPVQRKLLPLWAMRLLTLALLFPPFVVLIDGLARLRRRHPRRDPATRLAPQFARVLAYALPFLFAVLCMRLLGLLGILGAPAGPVLPATLPRGAVAVETVLLPLLLCALASLSLPTLMRRFGLPAHDLPILGVRRKRDSVHGATAAPVAAPRRAGSLSEDGASAGLALLLVLLAITCAIWLINPYTALLLIPALHLWLAIVDPNWRLAGPYLHRARALGLIVLALLPLALVLALYAHQLGYSAPGFAHAVVLLLAGGYLGVPAMLLFSLVLGCLAAATLLALSAPMPVALRVDINAPDGLPITVRGPMSYAGPGSLGGTESALRR
jgi:hypothetical protein